MIVELTTLMVFNGSMHGLPLVTHEAPVRSGLILAPFFLPRVKQSPPYEEVVRMKILKDLLLYMFITIFGLIMLIGIMPWCIYSAYRNNTDVVDELDRALETLKNNGL